MIIMTIDDLAVLIQGEFRVMRSELATKDELKYEAGLLATKEDLKNL
jgi:hypothetical protein